jgi:hypothetical protein
METLTQMENPLVCYCESCDDEIRENDELHTVNSTVKCEWCYGRKHMTEEQTRNSFQEYLEEMGELERLKIEDDRVAVCELYACYTDGLCKDGQISEELYNEMEAWV